MLIRPQPFYPYYASDNVRKLYLPTEEDVINGSAVAAYTPGSILWKDTADHTREFAHGLYWKKNIWVLLSFTVPLDEPSVADPLVTSNGSDTILIELLNADEQVVMSASWDVGWNHTWSYDCIEDQECEEVCDVYDEELEECLESHEECDEPFSVCQLQNFSFADSSDPIVYTGGGVPFMGIRSSHAGVSLYWWNWYIRVPHVISA